MKMTIDDVVMVLGRQTKTWQVYFLIVFALLGAVLAIVGFICGYGRIDTDIEALPEYAIRMGVGLLSFCIFFPLGYVMLLMKEMAKLGRQMEALKNLCEKQHRLNK